MEHTFNVTTRHIFNSAKAISGKPFIRNVLLFDAAELEGYVLSDLRILEELKDLSDLAPLVYSDYDDNNRRNIIESLGTVYKIWQDKDRLYCDLHVTGGPLKNLLYDMAENPGEYPQVGFQIIFEAAVLDKTLTHIIGVKSVDIVAVTGETTALFESHIHEYDEADGRELDKLEKELREQAEVKLAKNILTNAEIPVTDLNVKRVRFCDNEQSLYALLKQLRKDLSFEDDEDEEDGPDGLSREERLEKVEGTTPKGRTTEEWAKRLKESRKEHLLL